MAKPMNGLRREVKFQAGYDKRSEGKGYGQHCSEIRFLVHGEKGTIQFLLFTGWYPSIIAKAGSDWKDWSTLHSSIHNAPWDDTNKPMPADLGYHSLVPMYEGQEPMESCEYLGGKPCYYDGSGLNADRPFSILVHEGGEALWAFLENYYTERFTKFGSE